MDAGTFVISVRAWISLNNAVAISVLREIPITNSRVPRGGISRWVGARARACARESHDNKFYRSPWPANEPVAVPRIMDIRC